MLTWSIATTSDSTPRSSSGVRLRSCRTRPARERPLNAWHRAHARIAGVTPHPMARAILQRLPREPLFACLWQDDAYRACAIGVQENGLATLYNVVTEASYRRRGYARALVAYLLSIANERGAQGAYLNVVESNRAARQLYRGLDFRQLYRYWYRVPADWPHA